MKVRVFDPTPVEPSPAFAPQETPILGASEPGLVVQLGPTPGLVTFDDVVGLSVFRSSERGSEQAFLLFFLQGRPQPLVAEATRIRFHEFHIGRQAPGTESMRQVAIHICRRAGSVLVDRDTLTFMKSGGTLPLLESTMASLASAFGRMLQRPPGASPQPAAPPVQPAPPPVSSPHQTRPIPPQVQAPPPPSPLPPAAPRDMPAGPTPVMTQPFPAVTPAQVPPPVQVPPPEAPSFEAPLFEAPSFEETPLSEMPSPVPRPPPAPAPVSLPPIPTPAAAPPAAFHSMEVKVFEPLLDAEELAYQPHEVFQMRGGAEGLEVHPESIGHVAFGDVRGISVFRSPETGTEGTFLMLVVRHLPRPLIAETQHIRLTDFPIRQSPTATESLRQLVLYLCQKAGRMVMDRATGVFLQQGGLAPLLEKKVLALATALGQALGSSPEMAMPAPAPAPPVSSFGGPVLSDPLPAPWGDPGGGAQVSPASPGRVPPARPGQAVAAPSRADGETAAGEPEVENVAAAKPYTEWETFLYPVRGLAFLPLVGLVAYTVVTLLMSQGQFLSARCLVLNVLTLWFLAPILFSVVRSTAYGDNVLEELPSFFDIGPRAGDLFSFLLASLIPVSSSVLLWLGLRELLPRLTGSLAYHAAGVAASVLLAILFLGIWMMALGAAAMYNDVMTSVRIHLHVRALRKCWKPLLGIFARLVLFVIVTASVLWAVLAFFYDPQLSSSSTLILSILPTIALVWYIILETTHLLGLLFRRHEETLAAIYL